MYVEMCLWVVGVSKGVCLGTWPLQKLAPGLQFRKADFLVLPLSPSCQPQSLCTGHTWVVPVFQTDP
jgi:hypothetical protein